MRRIKIAQVPFHVVIYPNIQVKGSKLPMRSITAFAVSLSNLREFKTFIVSGSTNVPPLKAAIGADNLT